MEEKAILVGLDLTDEFTQLCYYTEAGELYSVSLSKDPMKYRIPTVLCAVRDSNEWLFGEEALAAVETASCVRVSGLVELASQDGALEVFGQSYPADMLLERYFRRLLAALKNKVGATRISGIVITAKTLNEKLKRNIISAVELLGIRGDSLRMITHLESFMYYVVSQNKDIWINDVGLFDFDRESFVFYRLSFGRRNLPLTVVADRTDLTDKINYGMLVPEEEKRFAGDAGADRTNNGTPEPVEAGRGNADGYAAGNTGTNRTNYGTPEPVDIDRLIYAFENTSALVLHKQIVSALYFTGAGFETSWADESLKKLCNGRRIFRGQNLYVKGAGYAAVLMFNGGAEDYFLVGDEVLRSSISLRAFSDGAYRETELASIGQRCSEAGAEVEVILDRTNELDLIVHNALKKDFICAIMTLDTLVQRDDRSVRLNIRLRFPDRNTCVITVRDVGFGEIYRTNHKIWEQVLKI